MHTIEELRKSIESIKFKNHKSNGTKPCTGSDFNELIKSVSDTLNMIVDELEQKK